MKVPCSCRFTAFGIVGILVSVAAPLSAFSPVSTTRSLTNLHLNVHDDKTKQHFWMSQHSSASLRRPVVAYMSDAASSTTEPSSHKTSKSPKNFLKRFAKVIPPAAERQKLVPLGLMFFCILFNYTILRDTKDVLMVRCSLFCRTNEAFVRVDLLTFLL